MSNPKPSIPKASHFGFILFIAIWNASLPVLLTCLIHARSPVWAGSCASALVLGDLIFARHWVGLRRRHEARLVNQDRDWS